jgi:ABC-type Fe3+ transport system permease subunit
MSVSVPVVLPSYLWAMGVSTLRPLLAYRHQWLVDGFSGSVFALTTTGVALVALGTYAVATQASTNCIESARLHGGRRCVLRSLLSFTWRPACAAAVFSASLAISDAGCSQVMGYHGVASEILIALASRGEIRWAMIQSVAVGVISLPFIVPAAIGLVRMLGEGHDTTGANRSTDGLAGGWTRFWAMILFAITMCLVALPVFGIIRPLLQPYSGRTISDAFSLWKESSAATFGCGLTAAVVAVFFSLAVCVAAGHTLRTYRAILVWSFTLFGLPASLHSLGIVFAASSSSGFLQSAIRSDWMVGAGLGIRLFPIALVMIAAAWLRIPRSYSEAAAIHGLGQVRFVGRIAGPLMASAIISAVAIVSLLGLSDVSAMMLLQPPGWVSYPTQVFGMMDNSSETKLAALGLVYLLFPATVLAVAVAFQLARFSATFLHDKLGA